MLLGRQLVPVGVLLMLLGVGLPVILQRLGEGAGMSLPLALAIDGSRLGFFVGLALLIVGLLRNRKQKKAASPSR
jgi:hypothetical protein